MQRALCVSLHKMGFQNLLLLLRMMKVKYHARILEEKKNAASAGNILRNDQMQRRKTSFQLLKRAFF